MSSDSSITLFLKTLSPKHARFYVMMSMYESTMIKIGSNDDTARQAASDFFETEICKILSKNTIGYENDDFEVII